MDIRSLVEAARAKGLAFHVEGDRIKVEAPLEPDLETKALIDTLRGHKAEVRQILLAPRQLHPPENASHPDFSFGDCDSGKEN